MKNSCHLLNIFVSWQVLTVIDTGDANLDYLGIDVALSGDANTMAVGLTLTGDATNAGLVRLYSRNGTDWNMSEQINGPAGTNGAFGISLDLSHDGLTLAITEANGAMYIYDYNYVTSVYDMINATADIDAAEVCVSGDGSTVGITSHTNVGATIFVRNGDAFQQRGSTFTDYGRRDSGIALSYNGTIVAIGDRHWDSSRGRVGVFQWSDDDGNGSMMWVQMGSDITGVSPSDSSGYSNCVSISYDGLTVSVGTYAYDRDGLSDRGLVRVYNRDSPSNTWNKIGIDLVGDNANGYFGNNALSSDGKHLAVGSFGPHGWGNSVTLFAKNGDNYEIVGEKLTSGEGKQFGWSVDISADGAAVAIGDNAFSSGKGRAYLLVRNGFTNTPSLVITKEPSVVPSTSPSIAPTAAVSKTDFALTFLKNDTIIEFDGTSTDKEITIKTLITNKVPRDSFEQTILVGTDCQFKFVDEYPDDTSLVTISNDKNLDVVTGKHIKVTSDVNIDTAVIASKGRHSTDPDNKSIYSEYEENNKEMAKIEFCIRTDYGKVNVTDINGNITESSMIYYEVKVVATFLMQIGFTSANVSIAEAEESTAEQAGTITAVLNACSCPAAAASEDDCLDTSVEYDQNDILSVCVYDPTENAIITSFKDVTLGNGEISTQVIDSDGKPTSLASVSKLNDVMAIVNTRIVSAFFDAGDGASPAAVTVSGVALIGFKTGGARKLTAVRMEGGKDMRKLQDDNEAAVEGEGAFDVEVLLSNDEQVDVGGSPGFDALEYLTTLVVLAMIPILF